jgi:hypothetical protein
MSRIGVIGDFSTRFAIKGGSTYVISIFLKEPPSSDVTVSFASTLSKFTTSASLTFTTANYHAPQALTITAVNTGTDGYLTDTLTISASGGGYSESVQKTVVIRDSGLPAFFLVGYNWMQGINRNITVSEAGVIESMFYNGGSKPTNAVPDSVTTNYTGSMHANNDGEVALADLSNVDSITQVTFVLEDRQGFEWTMQNYHIFNSNRTKDTCVFICLGHGSEGKATTIDILQNRIDNGYDVVFTAMPRGSYISGGGANTETNPNLSDHSNLFTSGVATNEVPQLFLFDSDKIQMLNYLDANFDYEDYAFGGLSGGGNTAVRICSYETRFKKGFSIRGFRHRPFRRTENTGRFGGEPDYEQMGAHEIYENCGLTLYDFCTINSYVNMAALCCSGGRQFLWHNHADDLTTSMSGYDYNVVFPVAQQMATRLGGTMTCVLDNDAGRTAHAYDAFSISKIEELFGDS